jgi:hypothetical protein
MLCSSDIAFAGFLWGLIFDLEDGGEGRYVPQKHLAAAELLGVATQKIIFFKCILLCYDVIN